MDHGTTNLEDDMLKLLSWSAAALLAATAHAQFVEPVTTIHEWVGENVNDRFGFINRNLGDVDGDGVNDAGVATPENDEGALNGGKVYIYSGATGELIRDHVGSLNDFLGYEMSGVGDLNGDDRAEYVISAPGTVNFQQIFGPGRALLFDGATGDLLHTWVGQAQFDTFGVLSAGAGNVLTNGAGDVDADGTPDILIGAILHDAAGPQSGRVYVYSGATYDPIWIVDGEDAGDLFGLGLGGVGDIDADGHADWVVGAPSAGPLQKGRAYVFSGRTGEPFDFSPLEPNDTGSGFGNLFASGPGDVDQDGTDDIFVSDLSDTTLGPTTGRSYVFSGVDGEVIREWAGEGPSEGFGVGRGCGDVDFDGHPDVVISSYQSDLLVPQGGKTFVLSGRTGEVIRTITGTIAGDLLGWSTVGMNDVNGDGAPDFMISSTENDEGGFKAGKVYVVAGDVLPCLADMNGDGQLDILDFVAFQLAFVAGDLGADCNADAELDVLDFVCFQVLFLKGC